MAYTVSNRFEAFGDACPETAETLSAAEGIATQMAEEIVEMFFTNGGGWYNWSTDGDQHTLYLPYGETLIPGVGDAEYVALMDRISDALEDVEDREDTYRINHDRLVDIIRDHAIEIVDDDAEDA